MKKVKGKDMKKKATDMNYMPPEHAMMTPEEHEKAMMGMMGKKGKKGKG